jgi:hypothetical protein
MLVLFHKNSTSLIGNQFLWQAFQEHSQLSFFFKLVTAYPFSFGLCVVYPSIYGFWLPLWYLQTLLLIKPPIELVLL